MILPILALCKSLLARDNLLVVSLYSALLVSLLLSFAKVAPFKQPQGLDVECSQTFW